MIENLDDFIDAFDEVKLLNWVQTHRSGPTGVGKTLEDLLEIPENNLDEPDLGEYELKAARKNNNSMLTMFTKAPEPARSNRVLLDKFGYSSDKYDNGKKVLHATLSADRFTKIEGSGVQLKLHCDEEKISIQSNDGIEDIYWSKDKLEKAFNKKYKNKLVYVKSDSRGTGDKEEFKYLEAYLLSGFDYDSMINFLEQGIIKVDIRIGQYSDGRIHDHGTAFRLATKDFPLMFQSELLDSKKL